MLQLSNSFEQYYNLYHLFGRTLSHPLNQSITQPVNQSIKQSIKHSNNRTRSQAVTDTDNRISSYPNYADIYHHFLKDIHINKWTSAMNNLLQECFFGTS